MNGFLTCTIAHADTQPALGLITGGLVDRCSPSAQRLRLRSNRPHRGWQGPGLIDPA